MFNYQAILDQLKAFLQGILIENLPIIESTGLSYLSATQQRLSTLASNASNLTKDEIIKALEDEKDIFISELKSFEEIGLSFSQEAINNAQAVVLTIFNSGLSQQY